MKSLTFIVVMMACAFLWMTVGVTQQTAEQMFQSALYKENVQGELDAAIGIYKTIIREHPENRSVMAKALLHVGMCYEKLGLRQAQEKYQEVIAKYPEQKEEVAVARAKLKNLKAYAAELRNKAEQHLKKGNELFRQWEYESAIQEYEKAIKLDSSSLLAQNARYCIGYSLFRAGKYDVALETFTNLIEQHPQSTIAPVTELMITQVQHAMEKAVTDESEKINSNEDADTVVDPETGIMYRRIQIFVGKNDLITYATGGFNLSPDDRFLVLENQVVPVNGSEPFMLVDMNALRAIYSPDMNKAAFYADSAIWTVPVSAETGHAIGPPKKLVEGRYRFQSPVSWSPDGKELAFSRDDQKVTADIWIASVSDAQLKPFIRSSQYEGSPVWSPDGRAIVYRKEQDLWLAPTNGGQARMIIRNGGYPHWSPDSKWLFHSNWQNNHLYSLAQDTNYKMNLPKQVGRFVSFSSDGKRMFFYRPSFDDKWGIKVVSTQGGPSFTPSIASAVYGSQWISDSERILAQSENKDGEVLFEIVPLTGERPVSVDIEADVDGKPFPFIASPDFKKIAFSVTRQDRKKDLYIIPFSLEESRTTGPARLVFEGWSGGAYNVSFAFSPNSTKIAVIHENDIWTVDLADGTPVQITDTPEQERWIRWSPNGRMISYLIPSKHTAKLHVIPATGGHSQILSQDCQSAKWSPNSDNMAILTSEEMKIISLSGETLKKIANRKDLGMADYSAPRYSPDGKSLAFIGHNDKNYLIYIYSIETEKITRLTEDDVVDLKYSLNWSPDGKWLSYLTEEIVKVRPEGTLWEADFEEIKEKVVK